MTMRNPNRTSKRERRAIRRYNRYAARVLGVAEAARWHREGILLDEARGFDNILAELKYGPVPLDLDARVTAALDAQRDRLERIMGTAPGTLKPTSSNSNYRSGTHTGHEVGPGPNAHITLTYPPHISLGTVTIPADEAQALARVWEAEFGPIPQGPGPYGDGAYQPASVPYHNGAHQADVWFGAFYQAYREGRERGDAEAWHEWHDPNEVAAMHAEAIENALNDDIDPGE